MISKLIFMLSLTVLPIALISCSRSSDQNINNQSKEIQVKNKTEGTVNLNKSIYDLSVKTMDGGTKEMSDYKEKVLLIVNVASECGFTAQYEGLERVYKKYSNHGLEILGFPCNDFGEQEPGTNEDIKTFCKTNYNITFPLFNKVKVLGNNKSPLYDWLMNNSEPAGAISWNFEKFLIDRKGNIVGRYKSKVKPESEELIKAIEIELKK